MHGFTDATRRIMAEDHLDAILDTLTEHADEWTSAALDANPTYGIDDIGPRALLRVLRDSEAVR